MPTAMLKKPSFKDEFARPEIEAADYSDELTDSHFEKINEILEANKDESNDGLINVKKPAWW